MQLMTIQQGMEKKNYIAPQLLVKGNIAELTQQNKAFGNGDGFYLIIPGVNDPVPIQNYS